MLDHLNALDDKVLGDPDVRRRRNARYWWAPLAPAAMFVVADIGATSRPYAVVVGVLCFSAGYWFAHRNEARA